MDKDGSYGGIQVLIVERVIVHVASAKRPPAVIGTETVAMGMLGIVAATDRAGVLPGVALLVANHDAPFSIEVPGKVVYCE